jgi:glucans biosynthesis protein C
LLLTPFVMGLILHYGAGKDWNAVVDAILDLSVYKNLKTLHLWFLYYLCIIYAICYIVRKTRPKPLLSVYWTLDRLVTNFEKRPVKVMSLLSLFTFVLIVPQMKGAIGTSISFIPHPFILLTHLFYFTFGYILYAHKAEFHVMFGNWRRHGIAASICFALYFMSYVYMQDNFLPPTLIISSLLCSLLSWLMIFFLLGLFLDKLKHPSASWTMISNSSYWIYIMHVPFTLLFSGMMMSWTIPSAFKCSLNIITTYAILLVTYRIFVARKPIGHFLNGKPAQASSPALAQ